MSLTIGSKELSVDAFLQRAEELLPKNGSVIRITQLTEKQITERYIVVSQCVTLIYNSVEAPFFGCPVQEVMILGLDLSCDFQTPLEKAEGFTGKYQLSSTVEYARRFDPTFTSSATIAVVRDNCLGYLIAVETSLTSMPLSLIRLIQQYML